MLRFCFLYQVLIYDQMIIPGDMGKLGAAFYISQRKDPGHVGLKPVIDRNKPVRIEMDPRCGDVLDRWYRAVRPEATRTWEAVTVRRRGVGACLCPCQAGCLLRSRPS